MVGLFLPGPKPPFCGPFPHFFFAQLRYRGGEWDPNPQFTEAIIEELELRTSIDAYRERRVVALSDPGLFFYPLLYMAGKYEFEPFSPREREMLRRFLSYGGFLFAEDTMGAKGFGFDRAFRSLKPKIVIPMHYWYQMNVLGRFIEGPYAVHSLDSNRITISQDALPPETEIIILKVVREGDL
jgi:hypothetical protein